MKTELLILRHGKSDWSVATDDFHRPLKQRGVKGARKIGAWIRTHDLQPGLVLSSPAERAIATARECCHNMGVTVSAIVEDERIYEADPTELLRVLRECPADARRVMLVGHNPGLEDLLLQLAAERVEIPADGKLLPTATLAHLQIDTAWSHLGPASAQLLKLVCARGLPD